MKNNFLINHKRFKETILRKDLKKFLSEKKKLFDFPHTGYQYYNYFNDYAKKNYTLEYLKCLCKKNDDILLSVTDRYGVELNTVVCKECGLIRTSKMFITENLTHFYQNHYRSITNDVPGFVDPEIFYNQQAENGLSKFELIKKYSKNEINRDTMIVDVGGGAGGVLENFKPSSNLYLADFFAPYQAVAKKNGLNVINGGLNKIDFKPDIIIISHVIEHWNEFDAEMQCLIKLQKINETLNYIEFPGVDSLKSGRRGGDILGDLHIPHVFYFSSYIFENIMNRYGFKKLYLDSKTRSIFIYTGQKNVLINYFSTLYQDLLLAEKRRRFEALKKFLRIILPVKIVNLAKKFIS